MGKRIYRFIRGKFTILRRQKMKELLGISAGTALSMTGLALSVGEITAILSLVSTGIGLVLLVINGLILPIIR